MRLWAAAALLFLGGPALAEPLSLSQAVDLAVKTQLDARLAQARSDEARAQALEAAAALLPDFFGTASQQRVFEENLAALGFSAKLLPGIPQLIGPYNVFDARFRLVQTVFDAAAIERSRASRRSAEAAALEVDLAREQVSGAAALAYVEALRAAKATESAQADEQLADALSRLAQERHSAGVSTGVDVARAETRAAQAHLKVIQVDVARREALLRLKRVAGLSLGENVELSDSLSSAPVASPEADAAVSQALAQRLEARILDKNLDAARLTLRQVEGQRLPTVTVNGDYGLSGPLPDSTARETSSIGAALSVPIFNGNLVSDQTREARARLDESQARAQDARAQIEEDARLAVESLSAATDQVATAEQVVGLAQRELRLARDRFAAGVGDNIEVVDAQDSLAEARDSQVAALAQLQVARINLALALGRMGAFRL